jgi:hypothetical protein
MSWPCDRCPECEWSTGWGPAASAHWVQHRCWLQVLGAECQALEHTQVLVVSVHVCWNMDGVMVCSGGEQDACAAAHCC